MDYEQVNIRTNKVVRTLRNIIDITTIPMGCKRAWFKKSKLGKGGSCKIKKGYELRKLEKRQSK